MRCFSFFGENSKLSLFWPKTSKIWPFWTKNDYFDLFFLNATINFHNFRYRNYIFGPLLQKHNVCAGKILKWPKFLSFWPFFFPFWPQMPILVYLFQTLHQHFIKLGQKLVTIAWNHFTVVLCLGKFSFWPFWPFFGQKYIACGDKIGTK